MLKKIFIIEPNQELTTPYTYLTAVYPGQLSLERFDNLEKAMIYMTLVPPYAVLVSASYSPEQLVTLLEFLKNHCDYTIVPLVIVVDLSKPINTILGTSWGGRMGVLTSISTQNELKATFERLTQGFTKLK